MGHQSGKLLVGARYGHVVEEELDPLVPVARVNLLRVIFLLVVVRFICDVNNLIKEASAQRGVVRRFCRRLVSHHFAAAFNALVHNPFSRLLHRLKHFLFLLVGKLSVQLASLLVLALS